jgi:hypothetical protein
MYHATKFTRPGCGGTRRHQEEKKTRDLKKGKGLNLSQRKFTLSLPKDGGAEQERPSTELSGSWRIPQISQINRHEG